MKVLLVRHGETDYNKNLLVQGHTDIPLNETGRNQAIEAAKKLSSYKISAAFSSPMGRANETCRLMLDNAGYESLEIITDHRVIEKNYGKFEGATYSEWYAGLASGDIDTVELDSNVASRIESFIVDKYSEYKDDTILVVCHGACTRIFLESKNLRPNKDVIINTSLNEVEYDGENFTLNKYNV